MRRLAPALVLVLSACAAGPVLPPPSSVCTDAILVLPGFGYDSAGRRSMERFANNVRTKGYTLYTADYVREEGLAASRQAILDFIKDNHIDQCKRLHILAFIAGAWSLNPLLEKSPPQNLRTLIYDRSPLQERAPRIASSRLPFFARRLFGEVIFELARTPYPALSPPSGVRTGLIVESRASSFIRFYKEEALAMGPVDFSFSAFGQKHDDAVYWPFDHSLMYNRFEELEPLVLEFIEKGSFPENSNRTTPGDPFSEPGN